MPHGLFRRRGRNETNIGRERARGRGTGRSEMSSAYSFPTIPPAEIVEILSQWQFPNIKVEDLRKPTPELVSSIYATFLSMIDADEDSSQAEFGALEFLENPDVHINSVRTMNLFEKMKRLISYTCMMNFTMRDLIRPKRDNTVRFISGIINFLFYRDDKLDLLRPIVDRISALETRYLELDAKKSELIKDTSDYENTSRMEQPIIEELEAEVKELQQNIQSRNKQQMSLRASYQKLNDEAKEIDVKISSIEFKLVESAQEQNRLHSKIVQSPDRLQRALEENRLIRIETQKSERLAKQCAQDKDSQIEVNLKAAAKLRKHLTTMESLQKQVIQAKAVDKDVKVLKAKLNDDGMLDMSLEAQKVERERQAEQAKENERATEKERDLKHREAIKELNNVKSEMESKLRDLEQRERNVEGSVVEADKINLKIVSVRESGLTTQRNLYSKCEEILSEVHNYSNSMDVQLLLDAM